MKATTVAVIVTADTVMITVGDMTEIVIIDTISHVIQ